MTANGVASPLNAAPKLVFKSKFDECYRLIVSGEPLTPRKDEAALERFFLDLFCLKVNPEVITNVFHPLSESALLNLCKLNVTLYFEHAINVLQNTSSLENDVLRRENVIMSLIPFMREVLCKKYSNYSYDIISLLAGHLDRSDAVFTGFISALDAMLRDPTLSVQTRHQVLRLCLLITCLAGQSSLVAYFLRRDMFYSVSAFLTSTPAKLQRSITPDALAFVGVLANYHKTNRNIYLVRLEDLLDEEFIRLALGTVQEEMFVCTQAYVEIKDDSPPSLSASIGSLLSSLNFTYTTPPVSPAKGKAREGLETPSSNEHDYGNMPAPSAALLLLPFYDLLYVNKAFAAQLFDPQFHDFIPTLLSLSSYIVAHASTSSRARHYAQLVLIILILLIEESLPSLTTTKASVRLCRQRQPSLPFHRVEQRPLINSLLDCLLLYFRHNLSKRLDVESHLLLRDRLGLKSVHKVMHALKNTNTRIDYDWTGIWRAVLSFSALIVNRFEDLKAIPNLGQLISKILTVLNFVCVWGESLFSHEDAQVQLYYEMLRFSSSLEKLGDLLQSLHSPSPATSSKRKLVDEAAAKHDQGMKNLQAILHHFQTRIADRQTRLAGDSLIGSEEVLEIIRHSAGQLSLVDSVVLEDIRPYSESHYETFFKTLLRDAASDALVMANLS